MQPRAAGATRAAPSQDRPFDHHPAERAIASEEGEVAVDATERAHQAVAFEDVDDSRDRLGGERDSTVEALRGESDAASGRGES